MRFEEGAVTFDMTAKATKGRIGVGQIDAGQIDVGRFVLRKVRQSDLALVALHAGDRRVAEATQSIPHPLRPEAAEAIVARAIAGDAAGDAAGEVWVMDGAASGLAAVLGMITLKRMDRGQSEVSFWVAPAFWNAGIASDAVRALVAANPQASRTIFAEVFQDNPGSARVLANAGFQYLGEAETHSLARGANVPTWTYIRKLD